MNKIAIEKLCYSKTRIFLRSNTIANGKKVEHMPKASVTRSVSSPQTEVRMEDSYESLKKTHTVDFEHQHKAINSINDEKLEVQMFSISY